MKKLPFEGLLLCVILIFIITSCDTEKHENFNDLLSITDSLIITIPNSVTHPDADIYGKRYFTGNQFSFLTKSPFKNLEINHYNIISNLWTTTSLETEGPNQVYGYGQFTINDNLIQYFPSSPQSALILNKEGKVINEYNFSSNYLVNCYDNHISFQTGQFQNILYFGISEYKSLDDPATYESTNLIGALNLKTGELRKMTTYPEEFHNQAWSTNQTNRNYEFVDNKIYISFSKSENIYVYDTLGNLLNQKKINTSKIKKAKGRPLDESVLNALKNEENGYYSNLIYDPFHDIFYRIGNYFDAPVRNFKEAKDLLDVRDKKKLVILTFSKNLELLSKSEFDFKKTGLVDQYAFVTENGLHLKTVLNTEENKMKFLQLKYIAEAK